MAYNLPLRKLKDLRELTDNTNKWEEGEQNQGKFQYKPYIGAKIILNIIYIYIYLIDLTGNIL